MTPTSPTPAGEMTPEQKLAAVIEAQVKGGCENHKDWIDHMLMPDCFAFREGRLQWCIDFQTHVLEILLDPQGLRAAYPSTTFKIPGIMRITVSAEGNAVPGKAAHAILDAWLSKPEGDPVAAIKTAYDLLPKQA